VSISMLVAMFSALLLGEVRCGGGDGAATLAKKGSCYDGPESGSERGRTKLNNHQPNTDAAGGVGTM
jgi:hypothetical protein